MKPTPEQRAALERLRRADAGETLIEIYCPRKDGDGIRNVCKALGIKHTYKAIRDYLNGGGHAS